MTAEKWAGHPRHFTVIELVLVFGGVLLFGWWQLRSVKRDQQAAAAKKLADAARERSTEPGLESPETLTPHRPRE